MSHTSRRGFTGLIDSVRNSRRFDAPWLWEHGAPKDFGPGHAAHLTTGGEAIRNRERASIHRNRTVYAHALVMFNVIGIPLSHGAYLEFYYTASLLNKSLTSISIIFALQILCIAAMPLPIGMCYQRLGKRAYWRLIYLTAGTTAFGAQLALQWCRQYTVIQILQGPILGCALGTLFTISTLVLASHYKHDLPLVSVQSGFAGFAGAVTHTLLAKQLFRRSQNHTDNGFAQAASAGVTGVTLAIAYILTKRVKENEQEPWTKRYRLKMTLPRRCFQDLRGNMWFVIGYLLIAFGILIYPVYIIVLLADAPALRSSDNGAAILLFVLGVAAFTAAVSANMRVMKSLGPVNTFIAAAIFAGAVALAPVQNPQLYVTLPLAGLYGVALGAVVALHMIVAAVFLSPKKMWLDDMPARVAILMALGGASAFAGILMTAVLVESLQNGAQIALRIAGGCLIGGGVLVACVRMWRWEKFFYAV